MNDGRSRYVCYTCTREVRGLVIMDGPWCTRCLRKCSVQRILDNFSDKVADAGVEVQSPSNQQLDRIVTEDESIARTDLAEFSTKILGKYAARGLFALPKKRPQETPHEDQRNSEVGS